ncbi:hypothetical protein GO003_013785 [Methylicorpusculum oleiharenae]|uniref:hypothetical protein n=1 Tax=Methylicorpusculum oleiharenae TaxID=1338687 RepID=UPI00135C3B84|nr:hypothetical protein [Methylicorpusculum oleiharenae]MCD2451461.1 hypothetical protein [Methylicorpusculum oleiharenae]
MKIDHTAIQAILPHRDPILLLDTIEITNPGISGKSILKFSQSLALWDTLTAAALKDELILEGAAQLLGVVLSSSNSPDRKPDEGGERLLLSFDQVDFDDPADSDLPVTVSVTVVSRFGSLSAGNFKAEQQQRKLASGKIVVLGG